MKNNNLPAHVLLCRSNLIGVGGAERVLYEQSKAFVDLGIKCSVLLFEASTKLLSGFDKRVNLIVLGQNRYDDILFIRNLIKLRKKIKEINPDLIIALQSLSDYLRIALIGIDKKYVLYKYTSLFYLANDTMKYSILHKKKYNQLVNSLLSYKETIDHKWNPKFKYRILNEYFAFRDWIGTRGAKYVLTLTSKSKSELSMLYNIDPLVWTPGHSFDQSKILGKEIINDMKKKYGFKNDEKIILSVNRLEYRKRVGLAIDGFHLFSKENEKIKLVIVGVGEEENMLKEKVNNYGLNDSVVFAGLVSDQDLINYYNISDICISMIWGSWALSVIEPLFFNKYQIISNEVPDLLSDVPNLIKVPPTPEGVFNGLIQAKKKKLKNSAEIMSKNYNWKKVTKNMLSLVGYS